jgi:VIT1/CCC1 family predicted Fe2+/Mn2+ transporter
MANERLLGRLDALIWSLIYGGLFLLVLGIAAHDQTEIGGWSLGVVGMLAAGAGAALVFVRARMSEAAPGAQSKKTVPENKP